MSKELQDQLSLVDDFDENQAQSQDENLWEKPGKIFSKTFLPHLTFNTVNTKDNSSTFVIKIKKPQTSKASEEEVPDECREPLQVPSFAKIEQNSSSTLEEEYESPKFILAELSNLPQFRQTHNLPTSMVVKSRQKDNINPLRELSLESLKTDFYQHQKKTNAEEIRNISFKNQTVLQENQPKKEASRSKNGGLKKRSRSRKSVEFDKENCLPAPLDSLNTMTMKTNLNPLKAELLKTRSKSTINVPTNKKSVQNSKEGKVSQECENVSSRVKRSSRSKSKRGKSQSTKQSLNTSKSHVSSSVTGSSMETSLHESEDHGLEKRKAPATKFTKIGSQLKSIMKKSKPLDSDGLFLKKIGPKNYPY